MLELEGDRNVQPVAQHPVKGQRNPESARDQRTGRRGIDKRGTASADDGGTGRNVSGTNHLHLAGCRTGDGNQRVGLGALLAAKVVIGWLL